MKRLLLTLIAAIALPTLVNANEKDLYKMTEIDLKDFDADKYLESLKSS